MQTRRILSIGQCAADHYRITQTFKDHFAAEVVGVDNGTEAAQILAQQEIDLILVNRILDASGSSGMEVIKGLKQSSEKSAIPTMLVSNYDDAQEEAVKLGAIKGFGKAALGQPAMLSAVLRVLEREKAPN
jgi:CheY-like chemotaxis protein